MTDRRLRPEAWWWLATAGAFAAGAALRLYRLPAQVLLGDEVHAVRAVLATPLPEILATYRITDYCLPLAGLARFVLERGGTLSELDFRWPVTVSGLLLLAAAPLVARRLASPRAAFVYPWLLAISPGLVLYSRIARSYAPASLLALAAVGAFFAWWRTGRRRYGAAYAVLGALAVWFSLVVGPFVAAALAFGVLAVLGRRWATGLPREAEGARRRRVGRPGWLGLFLVGLALAAGLACFLVPGWESLQQVLAAKPGRGEVRLASVLSALQLLAGTTRPLVAVLFWLLAARGLARLASRDRAAALFGAFLVAAQCAALAVTTPFGLANPVVLARYLIVALPVVLLWVAHGLEVPERWLLSLRRPGLARAAAGGAAALVLALLLATGPFARPGFRDSSFVHHEDFLAFHRPFPRLAAERIPPSYLGLARGPGTRARDQAIVELPSYPEGGNRALQLYQARHRRQVVLATPIPELNDPRLAFRNRVAPAPAAMLASGARYLVVHRDLEAEELAVELPPGVPRGWNRRQKNLSRHFRTVAAATVERLTAAWGPPDWQDAQVVVWDLGRVRARRLPPG
jgi:hypothetical protein